MVKDNLMVKSLIDFKYENDEINQLIKQYKKTKKERIKNKKFKLFFSKAVKERKIIKMEELVLLDYDVYRAMTEQIEEFKTKLKAREKE